MDLYILDQSLDQIAVLDTYKSLIWTDRYYSYGDFEIYIPISRDLLGYLKQDYYIQRKDSDRAMIIEKILINTDVEEGNYLTITGRSLESILLRRIVWRTTTIQGNLQNGIKKLLNENVISPTNGQRKISNFVFEESSDPAITSLTADAQYTGDVLYDVIAKLCSERGIGFKIVINEQKQFVFSLYAGEDRSYDQTTNTYVVFSPSFENIINSNYMESKSALKNVNLVAGEGEGTNRTQIAVGDVSGLDRRELYTDARDISSSINEEITEYFDFTQYPSQVFDDMSKTFVTDQMFNSSAVDISSIAGRRIKITAPKYTDPFQTPIRSYAAVLLNESGEYVETLLAYEAYGSGELTSKRGSLATYELSIPANAKFLYTSMFSQKAVDDDVYYGETSDFECSMIEISHNEYISLLIQRGREKLAENIEITSFEGEVDSMNMFKYGQDYFIGDIIQIANEYGHETTARILELVTSDDESGTSVYPTFSTITQEEGETSQT